MPTTPDAAGTSDPLSEALAANAAVTAALRGAEMVGWHGVDISDDPVRVCRDLVGKFRDAVDMGGMGMFLLDRETLQFRFAAAVPAEVEPLVCDEFERQLDAGMIGWAVREQRVVAVPSLTENPDSFNELGVVLLPVSTPRETWGIGVCFSSQRHDAIPQNALRILGILSHQIGLSIENAQLRKEARQQAERLEALVAERVAAARTAERKTPSSQPPNLR